jgi:two-component system response regulator RstA
MGNPWLGRLIHTDTIKASPSACQQALTVANLAGRTMEKLTILIVEDDAELATRIADFLRQQGFEVNIEGRGDRAVGRILAEQPALVVLDLMLPGKDGLSVCREVRNGYSAPILMLTARGDEIDEVVGLEVGADDYLAKPVKPRILLARVRALLRRPIAAPTTTTTRLEVDDLMIDPATREVSLCGSALTLTSAEFDLLWLLASNAGQIMNRKFIYQELRGTDYEAFDRAIDLRISRLRHKMDELSGGREIVKTVRGVGYLYVRR